MTAPRLVRLRLHHFRNFERLDWRPPAGRLLLLGANGAGKTTLLEAVYLAATTRSFRAARLSNCARNGNDTFSILAAAGERPSRELGLAWAAGESAHTLDGKATPLADHLAVLPVLAWSRAEGELVAGAPAARRRFVDRGLVHVRPALLEEQARYRRALAEKRSLLARGDRRGLEAWNLLLARHGATISAARAGLAAELGAELAELAARHAPDLPPVEIRYRPAHPAALDGEAALAAALERAASEELARGQMLIGPHRDDVELLWGGAAARRTVSAGESKALGLLLVAALGARLERAGRAPTLLIDDGDAELDSARLERLVAALGGFAGLLVTSSRPAAWDGLAGLTRVAVGALGRGADGGADGGS